MRSKAKLSPEDDRVVGHHLASLNELIAHTVSGIHLMTSEAVTKERAMTLVSSNLLLEGMRIAVARARMEGRPPSKAVFDSATQKLWREVTGEDQSSSYEWRIVGENEAE